MGPNAILIYIIAPTCWLLSLMLTWQAGAPFLIAFSVGNVAAFVVITIANIRLIVTGSID